MVEDTFVLPSGEIAVVKPEYLTAKQEMAALRRFVKEAQRMSPNGRRAAILWMVNALLDEDPRTT